MANEQDISLNAFLVCRDVLMNRRNSNVISIINIFNELQVDKFPAHLGTLCLVAIFSGAPGQYKHHFEIWSRDKLIGGTDPVDFFLESSISMFNSVTFLDGIISEEPQQLTFKSLINGHEKGRTGLGIFKPFKEETPEEQG